jgi:glutaconate CoA-transferase subunit B
MTRILAAADTASTHPYSDGELLSATSARLLAGRSIVFAGHGLPTLAVSLAQQTVAPDIELVYESGVTGARPNDLPLSISDSILVPGAAGVMPMTVLFNYILQGRRIDVGFLGAAQIDKYGSLNSTLIGSSWSHPKVKLPGSGGAIEVMAGAREVFVVMRRHTPATYVEDLDFRTTPSPHAAAAAIHGAMPNGCGVTHVISELGVLTRSEPHEQLRLTALHPGVSVDQVRHATGWELEVAPTVHTLPPPTEDELERLRLLDPARHYLR